MDTRIVIPVSEEKGVDSRLSENFGRAPYFAVVELDGEGKVLSLKTSPNVGEHFGGTGTPPDGILQHKPNAVITYGMGPRALNIFQNARVAVLKAGADTVREVIALYVNDRLEELTEGCHKALHR
jgi:predicted Fe-Mo cluster-binding NifX family protein